MRFRAAAAIATAVTAMLAFAPAANAFHDTGLPPDVAQAISELSYAAQMQCQSGNPQACGLAQQFQVTGYELGQAAQACRGGNQQACGAYQMGVQTIGNYYQQYQMSNLAQQGQMGQGQFGGGGYVSPQQHQANMHQMYVQQDRQQLNWEIQQFRNDIAHDNFIDMIRGD